MKVEIDNHGDPIERAHVQWLGIHLPGYIKIWQSYIGNDGQSHLAPVDGLEKEQELKRQSTSQYAYSCFESAIAIDRIKREVNNAPKVDIMTITGQDAYLRISDLVIAFYAHVGRIRDLVLKLAYMWKLPRIAEPLNEFYQRRNNVLHESKIPVWIMHGVLAILPPEGEIEDPDKWHKARLWTDVDINRFEYVADHIAETTREVTRYLNTALQVLYAERVALEVKTWKAPLQLEPEWFTQPPPLPSGILKSD